ncbi:MAG TPA: hypothetical protein VK420_02670 [Longimicrobium sp.]|nr:hypothetical protein [Longimicrobium sp.]
MRKSSILLALLVCAATASTAHAQPEAGFTLGSAGLSDVPSKIRLSGRTLLRVECTGGVSCSNLAARLRVAGRPDAPVAVSEAPTDARIVFNLNSSQLRGAAAASVAVLGDGGEIVAIAVEAGTGTPTDTVAVTDPPSLGKLLTRDCRPLLSRFRRASLYDAANNTAHFVVSPVGNVLARPGDRVDEDDIVRVYVLADRSVVPRLAVSRISEFRTPGQVHFAGEGSDFENVLKSAHTGRTAEAPCEIGEFAVTDFAPGKKGEVEIALVNDDGTQAQVGTFDFGVHTLYSGAFAFGPARTELRDPDFGVVARDGDNFVTVKEDGSPRVLYVLSFTPFIWGKRELEEPAPWYHHVNPTIGIVPAHLQENALLGVSIDVLNTLYLQGGVHAGRVRRLDTRSGLELGAKFTGTGDVPTVREWDADWFVGLSLDLRAAVEFLRIAATGTGG